MEYGTIWTKSTQNPYWLLERSYPVSYIRSELGLEAEGAETKPDELGRIYAYFAEGIDPNQECSQ